MYPLVFLIRMYGRACDIAFAVEVISAALALALTLPEPGLTNIGGMDGE
ncbi:hypothetical protein [Paenibacillus sp. EZ-K15]|nr:hypothetical protein [Paenibacillus sp. EZ-K15]